MNNDARHVRRVYFTLTLLSTLAASLIWGINTLFLLDAGLSNFEAFTANAFFSLGQVVFEVPTGVIADAWGRRTSYLLGALTLLISTLLYLLMWRIRAPFWGWAVSSALIGLGFTFFSGATEAWLVDCLNFYHYEGDLDSVFAGGQIIGGAAMLTGSVAGGYIAQIGNLGVPYVVRSAILGITLITAFVYMKDLGFSPAGDRTVIGRLRTVLKTSVESGLKQAAVRRVMLASPFTAGTGFFIFYAMQPYLLDLYGDQGAYGIAGLAAAIVAGAQVVGGFLVNPVRRMFRSRTGVLILSTVMSSAAVAVIGLSSNFPIAVIFLVAWATVNSAAVPIRQAYLNGLIPSEQRATLLSFDSLLGSAGSVVAQPVLGRAADAWGYPASYLVSAVVQLGALPFLFRARRENTPSDRIRGTE